MDDPEHVNPHQDRKVCHKSFALLDLKRYGSCKSPYYFVCSKECQRAGWKEHKMLCQFESQETRAFAYPAGPTPLVRSRIKTRINSICNPGDKLMHIHTSGQHVDYRPDLFAVDVPVDKCHIVSKFFGNPPLQTIREGL
jgi:hypothetical protein